MGSPSPCEIQNPPMLTWQFPRCKGPTCLLSLEGPLGFITGLAQSKGRRNATDKWDLSCQRSLPLGLFTNPAQGRQSTAENFHEHQNE